MRLVPEEIGFSGKFGPSFSIRGLDDLRPADYIGLNAALFEWAESYDSKVGISLRAHNDKLLIPPAILELGSP